MVLVTLTTDFGYKDYSISVIKAALFQQIGIVSTSATNAGFFTGLYVLMVPLIGIFLLKIPHWSIWPCVIICLKCQYCTTMRQVENSDGSVFGKIYKEHASICLFTYN